MKNVRLGLVGCGSRGIGVTRLFKAHPDCRITTLMDRFPAIVEQAGKTLELPVAALFTDYERMLREAEIDAVFLACDPMIQADMACRAMLAGKHVCTEVPAAFTLEECRQLIQTVEKTGMKYQLMEQTRYWGFIDAWKKMHDQGEFGHICLAQGEYIHYANNWDLWTDVKTGERVTSLQRPADREVEPRWRSKVLADPIYYLPHTLSPLLKILGDRVVSVSCLGTKKHSYTYPEEYLAWSDIQYALMRTANDTVLLVGAGFSLPHVPRGPLSAHWYELRGTKASASSPRHKTDGFRLWKQGMTIYQEMDWSPAPLAAGTLQAKSGHGGADFKPVDTFIRSILDNTPLPMDVYTAVETAAPAILAVESARQGGALIAVPDFRLRQHDQQGNSPANGGL
ncbi:MAG: Gfo/Idh/MocA family oxidoreductase [Kiritimatiellae bacterium]|nr:Gfo/Idh/MocA family oxidoreductase [Kiritimatiellia bacterium]